MSSWRSTTWLLIAASSAGLIDPAFAGEVILGAETSIRYDTNVAHTDTDEKDDGIADMGPTLRLREESRQLKYDLYYAPAYLQYFTEDQLSTWRHYARAQARYDLDERTSFTVFDRFYYTPSVVEAFIDSGGAATPTSTLGTQKYLFNDVGVGASHLFTNRLQGNLQLSNSIYEPKQDDTTSSTTWGGSTDLLYALTQTDRVGGGFGFNQQKYEPPFQPANRTRFYQFFGTWVHDFDPTWNFTVSAGPSLIDPDDPSLDNASVLAQPIPFASEARTYVSSTCEEVGGVRIFNPNTCSLSESEVLFDSLVNELIAGGLDAAAADAEARALLLDKVPPVLLTNTSSGGSAKAKVTYFASASMTKRWRNWEAILTYTRSAGSSSGFGTSNLLDTVSAVGVWRPSPLWYISLTGRWDQRQTASEQSVLVATVNPAGATFDSSVGPIAIPNVVELNGLTTVKVDSNDSLRDLSFLLYAQRRLTKRFTVFGKASYYNQKAKGDLSRGNNFDNAIVSIGIRYELAPIEIPFL